MEQVTSDQEKNVTIASQQTTPTNLLTIWNESTTIDSAAAPSYLDTIASLLRRHIVADPTMSNPVNAMKESLTVGPSGRRRPLLRQRLKHYWIGDVVLMTLLDRRHSSDAWSISGCAPAGRRCSQSLFFPSSFVGRRCRQRSSPAYSATLDEVEFVLDALETSTRTSMEATSSDAGVEESVPRSMFGTKEYWDDMYQGRGDFNAEEYSWYYGWERLKPHVQPLVSKAQRMLLPGIGNDPLLLDLVQAGYHQLTAHDYSIHALERQRDMLSYQYAHEEWMDRVQLISGDVRTLHLNSCSQPFFDAILEKGLLDAVYLSGDGQVERAVHSLTHVLKPGGIFVSVSGVVANDVRQQLFPPNQWRWLRDGSDDLQAGCFVFQKL